MLWSDGSCRWGPPCTRVDSGCTVYWSLQNLSYNHKSKNASKRNTRGIYHMELPNPARPNRPSRVISPPHLTTVHPLFLHECGNRLSPRIEQRKKRIEYSSR